MNHETEPERLAKRDKICKGIGGSMEFTKHEVVKTVTDFRIIFDEKDTVSGEEERINRRKKS